MRSEIDKAFTSHLSSQARPPVTSHSEPGSGSPNLSRPFPRSLSSTLALKLICKAAAAEVSVVRLFGPGNVGASFTGDVTQCCWSYTRAAEYPTSFLGRTKKSSYSIVHWSAEYC